MAFILSGVVGVQCIIFYKLYPNDKPRKKILVAFVWFLDLLHSSFICAALVDYFVTYFGDTSRIDHISWSIGLSIVVTAIQTLTCHFFFASKIHKSSGKNWFFTAPVLVLAFARLFAASVSTSEMIILKRYSAFNEHYPGWVFTTGLSLSAGVDIIITSCLCYFLRTIRKRLGSSESVMVHVVDTLTLYTLENGLLTCIAATSSLICWLVMPTNLVFLGLHFVIGKLYANSLLASLNTRKELRQIQTHMQPWTRSDTSYPILTGDDFGPYRIRDPFTYPTPLDAYRPLRKSKLQVNVSQTVERASDDYEDLRRNLHQLRPPYNQPIRRSPTILQWSPRLP